MSLQSPADAAAPPPRRWGVVAIIRRGEEMLVIKRSQAVVAPGAYCFPGGGIEGDETPREALIRELAEELNVAVTPLAAVWESTTPWGVHLEWWLAEIEPQAALTPNPAEVESLVWLTAAAMAELPGLLASNHAFLAELAAGRIVLSV